MTDDLKEAARQEHDLRARIETIIESMADGLVAVDAGGRILAFNRQLELLTGAASEDAEGRPVEEVLTLRDPQGAEVSLQLTSEEVSLGGIFLLPPRGDPVPVAVTTALLRAEDGRVSGGVAVVRDMTRDHELEKMKSEFLSNISHELRTPLTPIKGYAQILARPDVPRERAEQFAKGITESTTRLERIVELLVDFAAMEAGRLSPRPKSVDLTEMLSRLADEWSERASGHDVVLNVDAGLPEVMGDERLLRRSLDEVLDNAVKFSPEGGKILIEAHGASGGNGVVEVVVADEGIGIAPDDLPKIFTDFHQLDGSATRTYGGLGLGLSFVHRIVEAHDGRVRVESEPDRGTRLTISIPATAGRPPREED
jgi:two-component system sensor histidine kinase VicK